jgi:hypothetical protein
MTLQIGEVRVEASVKIIDDTVSLPKGTAVGATRMFDSFVPEWDLVFAHNKPLFREYLHTRI